MLRFLYETYAGVGLAGYHPPGHPGAFALKCVPSPGAFAKQKMLGGAGLKMMMSLGPGICINFLSNMKIVNTVICAEDSECYIKLLVCSQPIN